MAGPHLSEERTMAVPAEAQPLGPMPEIGVKRKSCFSFSNFIMTKGPEGKQLKLCIGPPTSLFPALPLGFSPTTSLSHRDN